MLAQNGIGEPKFQARTEELEELQFRIADALSGKGSLTIISGEAGIGKTRLAWESRRIAEATGFIVLDGRCLPGGLLPYSAFLETVRELELIGFKMDRDPFFSKESKDEVLLYFSWFLQDLSNKHPIWMLIDDIQWADSASLQLLHFLARECSRMPMVLVATYRDDEISSPVGNSDALSTIRHLCRERICNKISLANFDRKSVAKIVDDLLEGKADKSLQERIFQESGGNPLFVVETIRMLQESSRLVIRKGRWQGIFKEGDVPTTVRAITEQRIIGLSRPQRIILEFGAIEGSEFRLETMSSLLQRSKMLLAEDLEDIATSTHLIVERSDRYAFSHEMVRQVILANVSEARSKEIHHLIGLFLEENGPRDQDYFDLSNHFFYANDRDRCAKYSLLAGRQYLVKEAFAEALYFLRRTVETPLEGEDANSILSEAWEGIGDSEKVLGNCRHSSDSYDLSMVYSSPKDRARLLRKKAECWYPSSLTQDSEIIERIIEEAIEAGPDDFEKGEIESIRTGLERLNGSLERAEIHSVQAVNIFKGVNNPSRYSLELMLRGTLLLDQARVDQALKLIEESLDILSKHPNFTNESECRRNLARAYFHKGLLVKAVQEYFKSADLARKIGSNERKRAALFEAALCKLLAGEIDEAKKVEEELRDEAAESGLKWATSWHDVLLAHIEIIAGDRDKASELIEGALSILNQLDPKMKLAARALGNAVMSELLIADGKIDDAIFFFNSSRREFAGSIDGMFYESIACLWYATMMEDFGQYREAAAKYRICQHLFERFGNEYAVKAIESALYRTDARNKVEHD